MYEGQVDLNSGHIDFYPSGSDEPATLNLQIGKGGWRAAGTGIAGGLLAP